MNNFDFFEGTWTSHQRKLTKRLAGSDDWEEFPGYTRATRHLSGAASCDEVTFPTKGTSGLTLRLHDPATDLWSIYWVSGADPVLGLPPVVGRFDGDRGEFFCDDEHEGTPVRCRFLWIRIDADHCRWEQAFSVDGERTWETNWIADFTREHPAGTP
ncbi:hypothetical protein AB0K48_32420 [Nonomuraea sp. NPDC055795]